MNQSENLGIKDLVGLDISDDFPEESCLSQNSNDTTIFVGGLNKLTNNLIL